MSHSTINLTCKTQCSAVSTISDRVMSRIRAREFNNESSDALTVQAAARRRRNREVLTVGHRARYLSEGYAAHWVLLRK